MEIKKKEVITYKECYVAKDGTEFNDKAECEKYEESANFVIIKRYKDLVEHSTNECELFNCGSEDYIIDFVKVKDDSVVNIILQLLELNNANTKLARERLNNARGIQDYVLIGHYIDEDCYYLWNSRNDMLININNQVFFENNK